MTIFLSKGSKIWSSEKRYMVLDCVTGKPIRFGKHRKAIGSVEEALERCGDYKDNVVVELVCIIREDKL